MDTKKATGQTGSWFAKVDGIPLPCVHKHWLNGLNYHDPFHRHDGANDNKINELVSAIQNSSRVILTNDEPTIDHSGEVIGFKRTSYIAVFSVADVQYSETGGLRFRLAERICNLK